MWLGIGDLINKFRRNVLDLPALHMRQAISMMIDEKVSHTYCWSPSVVSKPADWPYYVDVSGYFFLDYDKEKFQPPKDLLAFLGLSSDDQEEKRDLSPPVFIGFGSITGHDSDRLLQVILDALEQTKLRALLSGFDVQSDRLPSTIFKIDDIPYDWLFQYGKSRSCSIRLISLHLILSIMCVSSWWCWNNIRGSSCWKTNDYSSILW